MTAGVPAVGAPLLGKSTAPAEGRDSVLPGVMFKCQLCCLSVSDNFF